MVNGLSFELITGFIAFFVLLFLSGLLSASETAYFSLNQFQIDSIKRSDNQKSRIIVLLLDNPKRLLATILVANIFINVTIVILASFLMLNLFGISADSLGILLLEIIVISSLILLLGEIFPKIYATRHNMRIACLMSRSLLFIQQLLYPLTSLMVNSTNLVERRIAHKGHNITMDELSEALDLTDTQGDSPDEERKILKGIIKFGDIAVREIMRPRVDVTAVDDSASFTELLEVIDESGYSRIPIYTENLDNVTGILYIKDLIPHIRQNPDFVWQPLQRPAFFVPENKRINDLLQEFQTKKIHMAIVVDEYGGTSGIVTLEDILEEIVGEINDEFDSELDEINYSKIEDNVYIFEGKTLLNDFCKVIGVDDRIFTEIKGESDTLAGLLLEMAGRIPEATEQFTFENFTFKPEVVDKRSIKRIKVTIKELKAED
ncbi:MAG TPA: gliding motility-associated protein GldE [Lentimicrobium sp.]|nr:gliding motility-associated protein GldE [Lentimicrobium sp.]